MSLWDAIDAQYGKREPQPKAKPSQAKGHSHNGKPCKSFGSCALQNFERLAQQKKQDMARKKARSATKTSELFEDKDKDGFLEGRNESTK